MLLKSAASGFSWGSPEPKQWSLIPQHGACWHSCSKNSQWHLAMGTGSPAISWPGQSAPAPKILLDCWVWEWNYNPQDNALKNGHKLLNMPFHKRDPGRVGGFPDFWTVFLTFALHSFLYKWRNERMHLPAPTHISFFLLHSLWSSDFNLNIWVNAEEAGRHFLCIKFIEDTDWIFFWQKLFSCFFICSQRV